MKLKYLQILGPLEYLLVLPFTHLVTFTFYFFLFSFFFSALLFWKHFISAPQVGFYKMDSYSIYVSWSASYASRYKVIVTYLNGTVFETLETPITSKDFQGLDPGEYIITVYSGNSEGFNLLEGTTIIASTNSNFFYFLFFIFFFFFF